MAPVASEASAWKSIPQNILLVGPPYCVSVDSEVSVVVHPNFYAHPISTVWAPRHRGCAGAYVVVRFQA